MRVRSKQDALAEIIETMSWHIGGAPEGLSISARLRNLAKLACRTVTRKMALPEHAETAGRVLIFQSLMRDDYNELVDNIHSALDSRSILFRAEFCEVRDMRPNVTSVVEFRKLCPRFLQFLLGCIGHRSLWFRSYRRRGFYHTSLLYLYFIKFYIDLKPLAKCRPESVVVFGEMQPLDRILTLLCHENNVKSATLQHGLYAEYQKIETINQYNYQPLFVDSFLAWGSHTAELISRYAPHVQVSVCGKPSLKELRRPPGGASYDYVLILDQNIFKDQNQAMIDLMAEISAERGHRMGVRFHPWNNPDDYSFAGITKLEGDEWLKAGCCVGHTSSFLIDILQAGIPVIRYASDAESVFQDDRVEFHDLGTLKALMDRGLPNSGVLLSEYIASRGRAAIDAHREAIVHLGQLPA